MDTTPEVSVDPRRRSTVVAIPVAVSTPEPINSITQKEEEEIISTINEGGVSENDMISERAEMDASIAATLADLTSMEDSHSQPSHHQQPEEEINNTDNTDDRIMDTGGDINGSSAIPIIQLESELMTGVSTGYSTPTEGIIGENDNLEREIINNDNDDTTSPSANLAGPSSSTTTTKQKGPVSRVAQLNARIEADPWDGEARLALIADAESKGDLERTRDAYEEFLKFFPDSSSQWIRYADLELSHDLKPEVEAIFGRCLRNSTSVDLWKFYLDYIRRINPTDPSLLGEASAKAARVLISQSFEFALQHVGQDRRAGDMWLEYINFLKERQAGGGNWEDQQRMDMLRKAYQRAVCIPLDNVESIWQEYNQFENNLNKMTAKKFVAELSPSYMTARKALRELRALFDHLETPSIPRRPNWNPSSSDRDMIELWKKYLLWEEANPLDLEGPGEVASRVGFAWKKAVASLRFFSEIWYLSATYYIKLAKTDEAKSLLTSGMSANPSSLLLAYTLADIEEESGEKPNCNTIYEELISHFNTRIAALETKVDTETTAAFEAYDEEASLNPSITQDAESRQKIVEDKETIKAEIKARSEGEILTAKGAAANVWITQMRFARRSEGIKQARSVFTKARKSPYVVWQVYEASATMEFYWNNEPKIATNIFELGLKNDIFAQDPDFILQYLEFLIQSNNPNNARALFERTVALIEPIKAKKVWDRMAQYEYQYGDFLAAQKIFSRYSEAFPEESPINRFASRHGYVGLDEIISIDLGTSTASNAPQSQQKVSGVQQERQSGSQSPLPFDQQSRNKRGPSVEPPRATYDRAVSVEPYAAGSLLGGGGGGGSGGEDYGSKRPKFAHEASPAAGGNTGWNSRVPPARDEEPVRESRGYRGGFAGPRADEEPEYAMSRRAAPPRERIPGRVAYALDPRTDVSSPLPDAVVFFLSILPGSGSFNGPILNPITVVEVISTTMLPGSAPGGGLPGERLGIPPRAKPTSAQYGRESPPRRGGDGGARGGRGGREPDYGYGSRDGGRPRYA